MGSAQGISPNILDTLMRLGLTEYPARCYVALLRLGEAEASAVAEAADVPRTKVYAALKDLIDGDWATTQGGRPALYRAAPPEQRIAAAEKQLAAEASAAIDELVELRQHATDVMPASIYLVRGEAAIVKKSVEVVSRASHEVFVNFGFLFDDERALVDAIERARRRGVRVTVLIGPFAGDARALGALREGAREAPMPFRGIIADFRQALLTFPGQPEPVAMWNPTHAFLEQVEPLMRPMFEGAAAWSAD